MCPSEPRILILVPPTPGTVAVTGDVLRAGLPAPRGADSLAAALAILADWRPHVVVVHMQHPDAGAWGVVRSLRAAGGAVQIVACTSEAFDQGAMDGVMAAGADDFRRQPFDVAAAVRLALARWSARELRDQWATRKLQVTGDVLRAARERRASVA